MAHGVANEDNPLDANLEKVLPSLQHWHSANNQAVSNLAQEFEAFREECREHLRQSAGQSDEQRKQSDRRLAQSFIQIAQALMAGSNNQSGRATSEDRLQAAMAMQEMGTLEDVEFMDTDNSSVLGVLNMHSVGDIENQEAREMEEAIDNVPCDHKDHRGFRMEARHKCLTDLWDEWHGLNNCSDKHGGIHGHDIKCDKKWRKHLSAHQHSQTKRIVYGVKAVADVHKITADESMERLAPHWDKCNHSVSNFIRHLQAINAVEKKKMRGTAKNKNTD